jgi:plastocyanin
VKRRFFLLILALVVLVIAVPIALAANRSAHSAAAKVGVSGKEFKFSLSSKSARHGSITFRFTNKGTLKHDFKIDGKKTPVIRRGTSASITVRLSRGTYKYICTVKGHAKAGMRGTFRVT